MSKLEIFRINENGAGWVDFSEATSDEKLNIELGLITNQIQMNCYFCHKQIPKGNACVNCKDKKGAIYFE
ncbi:MAG: hypothetical protein RIT47_684 [Pseudomonadota bacterium]|jgi:hypothetical protein